MVVYADSFFIVNFFMDSVLLFFVQFFNKSNVPVIKILSGAVGLALYSFCSLSVHLAFLCKPFPKALICCAVLFLVFGKRGFIKTIGVFWITAFILGGIIYAFTAETTLYSYISEPVCDVTPVISLLGCVLLYVLLYVLKKISIRNFSRENLILRIDVEYLSRHYVLNALIDTGCCLCDPLTGEGVILAEKDIFDSVPPPNSEINVSTAVDSKRLSLIFPDKTSGENKRYRVKTSVPIALCDKKLCSDGLYNAIINPDATEDIDDILEDISLSYNKSNSVLKNDSTSTERMNKIEVKDQI